MNQLGRSLPAVVPALFVGALLVVNGSLGTAGEPAPKSSTSAAPSGSAAQIPPPPALVRGADIPAERSPMPKAAEWAQAKEVAMDGPTSCQARLLREWLSVRCDEHYGASLVAGDSKDVRITANGELFAWDEVAQKMKPAFIEAIVPVERGKARIVTFLDLSGSSGDYGPGMPGEGTSVHVWWRDGEVDPSIVATQAR